MEIMRNSRKIEILKNSIERLRTGYHDGICSTLHESTSSQKEFEEILRFFSSQKPSLIKHFKFTQHSTWKGTEYWWKTGHQGMNQRVLFLNKLIYDLQPWYIKIFKWF